MCRVSVRSEVNVGSEGQECVGSEGQECVGSV